MNYGIYTKPGCPHCGRAKAALTAAGHTYNETNFNSPDMIAMFKLAGLKTFPQVFLRGELIGGADELELHLANSESDDF